MPDPDANVIAIFKNHAIRNDSKTAEAGRPIFDDMEVCELRYPGSRNVGVYPALEFARWVIDPLTGEQTKQSYAERFPRQYQQFKMRTAQTKSGTPLDHAVFLTEARRAELRALNVYTVEQLAGVDGQELKNLGPGGRDLKNAAIEFIENSKANVPNFQMQTELEILRAKNAVLEEDIEALRKHPEGEFEGMDLDALRAFITTNTGHAPAGTLNRKTLVRMAMDSRPEKAA